MTGLSGVRQLPRALPADRQGALAELFAAHHRRLVGLAAVMVGDRDAAEDIVQEAFLALSRRWSSLRDPEAAVAYLTRSVVNGGHDHLRRKQRVAYGRMRLVPLSEGLASAEQEAVTHSESERLWDAISALPPRQRQVVVLRYYLDQSEAEIAETLKVSRGSVKKHASRGLAALAQGWKDDET